MLVLLFLRLFIHILQLTSGHGESVAAPTLAPTFPAVRRLAAIPEEGVEADAMRRLIACDPIKIVRTARGRAANPSRRATTGDWSTYVCYEKVIQSVLVTTSPDQTGLQNLKGEGIILCVRGVQMRCP